MSGLCRAKQGATEEGVRLVDEGVKALVAFAPLAFFPMFASFAASAHQLTGTEGRAQSLLVQATETAAKAQIGWYLPEVRRQLALSQLQAGQIGPEDAVRLIAEVATLAQHQGAFALQWRAVTTLAKLLVQHGRTGEAAQRLREVCDLADVGLDSPELDDARALLTSLA